ncbi:hypothetical protein BGX38DRAFT_1263559 [Terfezia claveryi]|nr:hypothetical protein BGX38DRAFT_1263559 [Terfezia claveryi]
MPGKGKRKDNPGKRDRVQPPLKTRVPVTGHPQPPPQPPHPQSAHPQSARATTPAQPHRSPFPPPQPPHPQSAQPQSATATTPTQQATVAEYTETDTSDDEESIGDTRSDTDECSEEDPAISAALLLARGICRSQSGGQKEDIDIYRAVWCLREVMKFMNLDVESVFGDKPFRDCAEAFTRRLNDNGAAWVNDTPPIPPTISPTPPPPLPPASVTDTSTQTTPPTPAQKPTTNSVSTNTDHSPTTTYAEAATGSVKKQVVIPKEKIAPPPEESQAPPESSTPPPESQRGRAPPETRSKGKGRLAPPPETTSPSPTLARTIVLHAAPTKFKPGQMRRWIEEDNKLTGVQILGIRWLTQEHRRAGKMASSLVIYMKDRINLDQGLRMGRRLFRTTVYDWNR